MGEQYDIAAVRHMSSAECLEQGGHLDDAGYHVGMCAENAVKCAMREAGLEQHWRSQGRSSFRACPMQGHWSKLQEKIAAAGLEINLYGVGRRVGPLRTLAALGPTARFSDWSIDIRYADPLHVPVQAQKLARWKQDAADFITKFVV